MKKSDGSPGDRPAPPSGCEDWGEADFLVRRQMLLERIDVLAEELERWSGPALPEECGGKALRIGNRGPQKEHGLRLRDAESFAALAAELEERTGSDGMRAPGDGYSATRRRIPRPSWDSVLRATGTFSDMDRRVFLALLPPLIGCLAALLWLGWKSMRQSGRIAERLDALTSEWTPGEAELGFAGASVGHRAEAERVMAGYFSADGWTEKLRHVRSSAGIADRMRDYYLRHQGADRRRELQRVLGHRSDRIGDLMLHRFSVALGGPPDALVVPLVQEVEGDEFRFAVDWEALVQYSTVSWVEFVEARDPSVGTVRFRLLMRLDDFYGYGYEEGEHVCFRVRNREDTAFAYAYMAAADPGLSEIGRAALEARMGGRQNAEGEIAVTLSLRFAAGPALDSPAALTDVASFDGAGWVLPSGG